MSNLSNWKFVPGRLKAYHGIPDDKKENLLRMFAKKEKDIYWADLTASQRVTAHWLINEGFLKVTSGTMGAYHGMYSLEITDKGLQKLFLQDL